jgi:hypothetical protein
MNIVFYQLWSRPLPVLHLALFLHGSLPLPPRRRAAVRLVTLDSVIRDSSLVEIGVLSGRKDRGRGNWPIRHGALSAIDTASAQATSLRGGVVHEAHAS